MLTLRSSERQFIKVIMAEPSKLTFKEAILILVSWTYNLVQIHGNSVYNAITVSFTCTNREIRFPLRECF